MFGPHYKRCSHNWWVGDTECARTVQPHLLEGEHLFLLALELLLERCYGLRGRAVNKVTHLIGTYTRSKIVPVFQSPSKMTKI